MQHDFIAFLEKKLSGSLPGFQAQQRMSPSLRPGLFPQKNIAPRKSSVLILLYFLGEKIFIPFIERTRDGSVHSGQISLPGGKYEKRDQNLIQTALREAHEEIGVAPAQVQVLGSLSRLYIPASHFDVLPVVGYAQSFPRFEINPAEVQAIIQARLARLFAPENCRTKTIEIKRKSHEKISIQAPYYCIDQWHVWGATAMIISEFEEIVKEYFL